MSNNQSSACKLKSATLINESSVPLSSKSEVERGSSQGTPLKLQLVYWRLSVHRKTALNPLILELDLWTSWIRLELVSHSIQSAVCTPCAWQLRGKPESYHKCHYRVNCKRASRNSFTRLNILPLAMFKMYIPCLRFDLKRNYLNLSLPLSPNGRNYNRMELKLETTLTALSCAIKLNNWVPGNLPYHQVNTESGTSLNLRLANEPAASSTNAPKRHSISSKYW